MIPGLLAALPAIALGWIIVRLLMPAGGWKPAWLQWVLELSLGAGIGEGLTSVLYFVLLWAGAASRVSVLAVELAGLAIGGWLLIRRKREHRKRSATQRFAWNWAIRGAAALAVLLFSLDFGQATTANPNGEWDAFSVWNVRARFLASGPPSWRNAVSPDSASGLIGASHPSYPLLVSSSVSRLWTLTGEISPGEPAVVSLLFALAAAGLLCGALAWLRGESLGLLALLILLATEGFVSQAASQYADIPLSFYILGTVVMFGAAAARDWPPGLAALAGLCAGLAAWTKNEGIPFLVIAAIVIAWRGGLRAATWMAAGAAPGALVTLAFKLGLSPGGEAILPKTLHEALSKVGDPSRWLRVAVSFIRSVWELGVPWTHPVLLLAVLGFAFGMVARDERRSRWWLFVPIAGLLAVDFGIYLVTTADLGWHLDTSNSRLFVQVWPAVVFGIALMLRLPVSPEPEPALAAAGKRASEPDKRRRKR